MTPTDKPRTPPPGALDDPDDENTSPTGEVPLRVASPTPGRARAPVEPRGGDPFIGKVLDHRYRLTQLVARGGMGRVYRAEQAPLNRVVAVKILESAEGQDEEFRDRFIREAAACARLAHPNTIRIFDYGNTWDDIHYIAMEYLEGRNLHTVIRSEAPLAPARVVHIAAQVSASLREAHQLGLIHRDLKPSNVMLLGQPGEPEFVKVLDFGLVKELRGESELTRADAVVGSPSYMSPEQIRAAAVDQRSDIYALGVLMFACLTGRTPFSGANTVNVLMAHLSTPPPALAAANPDARVGPVLEWVVRTCLAKEPEDRFANVDELRKALALAADEAAGRPAAVPTLVAGRVHLVEDAPSASNPSMVSRPRVADDVTAPDPSPSRSSLSSASRPRPSRGLPIALALGALGVGALGVLILVAWVATRAPWASAPVPPTATAGTADPGTAAGAPAEASADAGAEPAAADPGAATEPPAADAATTPSAAPAPSGARAPRARPSSGSSGAAAAPEPEPAPDSPPPAAAPAPASGAGRPASDLRDPWNDR